MGFVEHSEEPAMNEQSHALGSDELVLAYYAAYNARDAGRIRSLIAPNFRQERGRGGVEGADALVAVLEKEWQDRPDSRIDVREVTAAGDRVFAEAAWVVSSLNPVTLPDGSTLQPTGQRATLPMAAVYDLRDGLLASERAYYNNLALWRDLGPTITIT